MSVAATAISESSVLVGSQFSEPMRVIGNPTVCDGFVLVNLVGTRSILESLREHWGGLTLFVEQSEIPMDNNGAERTARPRVAEILRRMQDMSDVEFASPFLFP